MLPKEQIVHVWMHGLFQTFQPVSRELLTNSRLVCTGRGKWRSLEIWTTSTFLYENTFTFRVDQTLVSWKKSTLSWWHRENYICTTILTLNPTLILMGTRVMIIFMPIPSGDNMGAKYTFWFLNARSFLHKINKKRTSYNTVCMHSCNIFQYFYVTGYTDKLKPQKQIRDSCTRVCHPKCLFFIADRCQNSRITF